ncbi:hypothetical protein NLV77_000833 [Staphylococcus ureilyticus]|uniref:protein bicaudal D homolog n=1 Tax=Staphylococcus ureilyticus TaxID=94138 RepID=UPI00215738EF|nr:protein bicaudal D homolog [Staphylococcus ureilyticus]MDV3051898.1 hypothetical protein [Staphylococcus ureilyticus]
MEYSIEEFQYSSLPQELSDSIIEKENILNGIKHRYAKEVGKIFYEAQQEFSDFNNGGLFEKWYSSLGFKKRNVYNYIQIYNEVQQLHGDQLETFEELPKRLQLEVSKPSHNPELKEKVLDGDVKTHKEYKELEQQLKQRDEEKSHLESQLEQAQRSESIARKQLEEAEDREPEVIEKYMEPEDYQSIKNMNEHLQSEREYYKKQADDFRNEVRDIMNQPNETTEFTRKDDNKDYTPILIHLLKPAEEFINYYSHHISKEKALNEIEKIKNILKEQ